MTVLPAAAFAAAEQLIPIPAGRACRSPHNRWHPIRIMLNNFRWSLMDYKYKGEALAFSLQAGRYSPADARAACAGIAAIEHGAPANEARPIHCPSIAHARLASPGQARQSHAPQVGLKLIFTCLLLSCRHHFPLQARRCCASLACRTQSCARVALPTTRPARRSWLCRKATSPAAGWRVLMWRRWRWRR